MTEWKRNEIVRRQQAGASLRSIARSLQLSRKAVQGVLRRLEQQRTGAKTPRKRRPSKLDPHETFMRELLERYPNITAVRMLEELRGRGYRGGKSIVTERVQQLRVKPQREPVVRFETAPGAQAQMDYAVYDIDFTDEGRRRVYLFGYTLGYSRRQYLHFAESQDFATTIREHVRAFEHLGGLAATCLYDHQKVVVQGYESGEPIFNPRFLAFATHYGYRPRLCAPRRPQTKGKQERCFDYVEKNLLNARTFRSLAHLNEVTAWWLETVADVRVHRETKKRPTDAHAEELPHLIALPAQAYDTAQVVYRVVNIEGYVAFRQNLYSTPWRHLGQTVPVRITEDEVIIYDPQLEEIARHGLLPRHVTGQRVQRPEHRPRDDTRLREALLEQRFDELGPAARRFLDGLRQTRSYAKSQACKVLGLLTIYARNDVLDALQRAVRYGAFSLAAVERILAAQARPKSVLESLAEEDREHLRPLLSEPPIEPRATGDYQHLFTDEDEDDHGEEEEPPHAKCH